MTDARIPLPADDELDEPARAFLAGAASLNIARMLARTGVVTEYFALLKAMFHGDWFPPLDREIMVLRTSAANGSTYEIPQHVAYVTAAGVSRELVDAVLRTSTDDAEGKPGDDTLTPWQRTLCSLCDEMAREAKLSPASVQTLVDHYGGDDMACRAILLMSWFNMLSRYADSTGVPVEEGDDPYAGMTMDGGPVGRPS